MKKLGFIIISLFILFMTIFNLIPKVFAAVTVTDLSALKQAINDGETEITINDTIIMNEQITVENGKDITLKGNGTLILSDSWSGQVPFTIERGASLTIDGVTLDGNGEKVAMRGVCDTTYVGGACKPGSFIYCAGTFNKIV